MFFSLFSLLIFSYHDWKRRRRLIPQQKKDKRMMINHMYGLSASKVNRHIDRMSNSSSNSSSCYGSIPTTEVVTNVIV